jgi:hypothetical protein
MDSACFELNLVFNSFHRFIPCGFAGYGQVKSA